MNGLRPAYEHVKETLMRKGMRGLCLVALLAVAGCAQVATVTRVPEPSRERVALTDELKSLYRQVATDAGMIRAIDGYADLYLKSPNRNAKAYCTVQLQKSRDARLIVTAGILGWPVADMLIRPDSLFVNDMLNNRLLVGRNNGENLGKIIGVRAGFGRVTETLFGIADMDEPSSAIESVRQGDGKVSFMVRSGDGKKELLVDKASKVLEGITLFDPAGRKSVEFRFIGSRLQPSGTGQVSMPKEIDMTLFRENEAEGTRSLRVVYDEKVIINSPGFTINFKRPKRAKTVNLDEVDRMPWL
ncbi:MAG TPA: DUF4292 domain-containing protein [Chlorobaculum sp.]|nr:DUF4292 domain-containing protein [Chlorobaculum sp.]